MPKSTPRQRRTEGRVMHEFKHGELTTGADGKGGRVKSRKQAVAIALSEAGASRYESRHKKRSRRAKTEPKEAKGKTGQQEREGKRTLVPKVNVRARALKAAAMRPARPRLENAARGPA